MTLGPADAPRKLTVKMHGDYRSGKTQLLIAIERFAFVVVAVVLAVDVERDPIFPSGAGLDPDLVTKLDDVDGSPWEGVSVASLTTKKQMPLFTRGGHGVPPVNVDVAAGKLDTSPQDKRILELFPSTMSCAYGSFGKTLAPLPLDAGQPSQGQRVVSDTFISRTIVAYAFGALCGGLLLLALWVAR